MPKLNRLKILRNAKKRQKLKHTYTRQATSKFLNLPTDIIVDIFERLPLRDALNLSKTCTRLHAIFAHNCAYITRENRENREKIASVAEYETAMKWMIAPTNPKHYCTRYNISLWSKELLMTMPCRSFKIINPNQEQMCEITPANAHLFKESMFNLNLRAYHRSLIEKYVPQKMWADAYVIGDCFTRFRNYSREQLALLPADFPRSSEFVAKQVTTIFLNAYPFADTLPTWFAEAKLNVKRSDRNLWAIVYNFVDPQHSHVCVMVSVLNIEERIQRFDLFWCKMYYAYRKDKLYAHLEIFTYLLCVQEGYTFNAEMTRAHDLTANISAVTYMLRDCPLRYNLFAAIYISFLKGFCRKSQLEILANFLRNKKGRWQDTSCNLRINGGAISFSLFRTNQGNNDVCYLTYADETYESFFSRK